MKTNSKIMILVMLAGALASCSNQNNSTPEPAEQGITFSFAEQGYESDQDLTRANSRPQTINLGDCEAEVLVENDPDTTSTSTHTRAINNKHYTIRAYQAGVRKGEMSGIFNGSTFTPDATSQKDMILEKGQSYDFVAFNDDVIPSPSSEELSISIDKVGTAYIGTATALINAPKKQEINFEMKHVGARLRTQFVCQKHIPGSIAATLEATAANVIPTTVSYDPATKAYNSTNGAMTPQSSNSPASTETRYTASNYGQTFAYTSTSNYHYFLPNTAGSNLKLNFNAGTVFWKPLSGAIPKLNGSLSMGSNKSYLIKIKLKPKFTYLFSDGTIGFRSETTFGGAPAATAKTPIGVVVGQNRAAALSYAGDAGWPFWQDGGGQALTTMSGNFQTNMQDMKGYEYTWETTYSTNSLIKATEYYKYRSFCQAAEYNRNATPWQTTHKWYLPANGEWSLIFSLGFGDMSQLRNNNVPSNLVYDYQAPWYGYLVQQAFTQVGGTIYLNRYHYTSSETTPAYFAEPFPSIAFLRWAGSGVKGQNPYTYLNKPFNKY